METLKELKRGPFYLWTIKVLWIVFFVCVFTNCVYAISNKQVQNYNKLKSQLNSHLLSSLNERIKTYWSTRANLEFSKLFLMESPYIRFLTPFKIYKLYLANTIRPKDVKIKNIGCKNSIDGIFCKTYIQLSTKEKSIFLNDEWIWLKNKWYHVIKDPIVYPNCFPP